jgi:SAM-dependent methyltransferase
MNFKDHFSGVADAYAAARPEYPDELFELVAREVPRSANVWEPGCGSGQATRGLAARFAHVHAADPSAQQIAQHWAHAALVPYALDAPAAERHGEQQRHHNVSLAVEPGERTVLPHASVQLVAVAQALHWFDRKAFFAECDRVLAPGGVLAAWGYADFIAPEGMVDAVEDFRALIEPYWPPERVLIDAHYAGFEWPFPALPAPPLWLEAEWSLPHFLRYLSSMSATSRCRADIGVDPVARHGPALAAAWGDAAEPRMVRWPLFLHLRRKPEGDPRPGIAAS